MNEEILRNLILHRLRRMAHHAWNESKECHEKDLSELAVYKDGQSYGLMVAINMLEVALEKENVE